MKCALLLALVALCVTPARAQSPPSSSQRVSPDNAAATQKLTVVVTDENGVAVATARVQLQAQPPALPFRCQTDFAGRCEFASLSSETYELRVEKTGFYASVQANVQASVTALVDVTQIGRASCRERVYLAV